MISLESEYYHKLNIALDLAVNNQDLSDWSNVIKNPHSDAFLNLLTNPNGEKVLRENGFSTLKEFFIGVEEFMDIAVDNANKVKEQKKEPLRKKEPDHNE